MHPQVVLARLYQNASEAYHQHRQTGTVPLSFSSQTSGTEDLAVFGGQKRIIRAISSRPQTRNMSTSSAEAPESFSQYRSENQSPLPIHESLNDYLGYFPASAFAPGFDIQGNLQNAATRFPEIGTTTDLDLHYYPSITVWNPPSGQLLVNSFSENGVHDHPRESSGPWLNFMSSLT